MSAELEFLAREVRPAAPPSAPATTYHRPASTSDGGLDSLLQTLVNEAEVVPPAPPSAPRTQALEVRSSPPARRRVGSVVAGAVSLALLAAFALAGVRRGAVRVSVATPGGAAAMSNLEQFLARSGEDFLL